MSLISILGGVSVSDLTALAARVAKLELSRVSAQGPQGIQGPAGPQGVQGATGPQGAQGIPGPAGVTSVYSQPAPVSPISSPTQTSTPDTGSGIGLFIDANTYPLTLSAPDAANTQTAGEGPNRLDFYLASNPQGGVPNNIIILVNNKAVIAPNFTVTSMVGTSTASDNHLVLKGPWGPSPIVQIKGVAPNGINGLWMNGCTIDYVDLVGNGVYNSRGGAIVNSPTVWVSNGSNITLTLPVAAATSTAAPAATLTQINGLPLSGLLSAAAPGSTTTLPAETIVGTSLVPANVAGAGMGKTVVDATNVAITYSKGILVPSANGVTISQMTVQNAYINADLGLNGAGVRNTDSSVGFTLDTVEIVGCQNGILTDAATSEPMTVKGCNIHGNGEVTKPGNTHNLYMGGSPAAVFTIENSTVSSCRDAHEVKSRCGTTNGSNNIITTGGLGSCYDIPNGGIFTSTNDKLTLPAGAADRNFITYAMENTNNAAIGNTVTIKGTVFIDLTGQGGLIQTHDASATINLDDCTYTGPIAPQIVGFGTVNGTITKAA
jgi:hypothetical protein